METTYEALRDGERHNPARLYARITILRNQFYTESGDNLAFDRFPPPFPQHEGLKCWGCEVMVPWHTSVRLPGPDGRPRLVDAHQCNGPQIDSYPKLPPWRTPHDR